jgi:hypothetical protein
MFFDVTFGAFQVSMLSTKLTISRVLFTLGAPEILIDGIYRHGDLEINAWSQSLASS